MRFLVLIPLVLITASCQQQREYSPVEVVQENYVHKYGVDVPQEDWHQRGQSGKVVTTLKNGVVVEKYYDEGQLNGQATYSFPHSSQIETYETYENGELLRQVINYPSGSPKQQTVYGPRVTKQITIWYDGGSPQSVEEYKRDVLVNGQYFSKQNQLESTVENGNGIRTLRDSYGQLNSTDTIQDGGMVSRTDFHPNGHPSQITPYNDQGIVEGHCRSFNPDGSPACVEQWKNGTQTGYTVEFQNGEKVAEVLYVNGLKNGTEKRYRDGTSLIQETQWIDGKKHGPSVTYIGENAKTDYYFRDRLVSKKEFDILSHDKGV